MRDGTGDQALQNCLEEAVKAGTALHWAGCVVTKQKISPLHIAGVSSPDGDALKPDALYWLASASKLCISLAILHVIEAGKIKGFTWDDFDNPDALTAILPELKVGSDHWFMHIFEGWEGDVEDRKPKLRKAERPVTLRHLLTWTAACRGQLFDKNMTLLRSAGSRGRAHLPEVMGNADGTLCEPRYAEAGTKDSFGYGSSANDWLGIFLSRGTGTTQRQAIQDFVAKPLGISEEDLNHYLSPPRRARKLPIHAKTPDGWIAVPLEPSSASWSDGPPAGYHEFGNAGLFGTISAYAKILQAVLTHSPKLLSEEHWDYVLQDDLARRKEKVVLPSILWTNEATPQATATVKMENTDLGTSMVQSLVERHPTDFGFAPGTLHWYGLSNVAWWVDPSNGIAGVVGTQTAPFWNDDAVKTFRAFQRVAYDQLEQKA